MRKFTYLTLHMQLLRAEELLDPTFLVEEHFDNAVFDWCTRTSELVAGLVSPFPGLEERGMNERQESDLRKKAHGVLEMRGFETHKDRKEFLKALSRALEDLGSKGVIPTDSECPGAMWRVLVAGGSFLGDLAQEIDSLAGSEVPEVRSF